jgi:uncharacterized protein
VLAFPAPERKPVRGCGAVDELTLLGWRRRVFELYADVRAERDPEKGWLRWRAARDELFRCHPQSPLPVERRASFTGVPYFPYDPELRVLGTVEPAERVRREIATSGVGLTPPRESEGAGSAGAGAEYSGEGPYAFTRFGRAAFGLAGAPQTLDLYWLEGYGGGVFLSFADGTSGRETYGACRYLLDTVKGADLGERDGRLVLDFNFAYNPSCAYDPRWVCPLAPPGNRLAVPVRAGERVAG